MQLPAYLRKISILLAGSGIAQVANFIITSFLTRLYLPEQFGAQVVFITISFYFSVAFTGKYELALMIPRELSKAASIVKLSIKLLITLSLLAVPLFYFFGPHIFQSLNLSDVGPISWLIPFSIITLGLSSIFNYWNTREENYKLLSSIRIIEVILTGAISFFFFKISMQGLIWASLLATGVSATIFYFFFKKEIKDVDARSHSLKGLAKEYADFPKSNIALSLIDAFQFTGITLLISYFFGAVVAGYFALCNRILQAPFGLIIKPISQVYFAESSSIARENKQLYPITIATIKRTGMIALPVLVVILLAGPYLFSLVFGEKWFISGVYAQILIVWFAFEFIKTPISQLAVILRKQKEMLLINGSSLIIFLILPFVIKDLIVSPTVFLCYTSGFHILLTIYFLYWFMKIAKVHDKQLL
jgi:O-antigen/teichoic acid export membrane protein